MYIINNKYYKSLYNIFLFDDAITLFSIEYISLLFNNTFNSDKSIEFYLVGFFKLLSNNIYVFIFLVISADNRI